MDLTELRRHWEIFGQTDALWAILTDPAKQHNRWDLDEFFATGVLEIECLMDYLATLPVPCRLGRALDFGCGVGRLTQALCRYAHAVDGVDIANSMIELAQRYNRYPERCRYHVNVRADLRLFDDASFDFIYSSLVLQHIEPMYSRQYLREFMRVLAPGGLAVFQVPSEPASPDRRREPGGLFQALITPEATTLEAPAGARLALRFRVRNASPERWPAPDGQLVKYRVQLGNHWSTADGRLLRFDDARAGLPRDLGPSESVDLVLPVTVPESPGAYILEVDMVQEFVAWFKDQGSQSVRIPVTVTGAVSGSTSPTVDDSAAKPSASNPAVDARMEMHCLPRDEVSGIVAASGGRLVDVQESADAGPELVNYRYCVTKV